MVHTASLLGTHTLGEFGSAARLSKKPGSVWNCLLGHAVKRSPGINHKSRVFYHGPGFLSSATWPLLPKKHYNGLINQSTCGKLGLCLSWVKPKTFKQVVMASRLAFSFDRIHNDRSDPCLYNVIKWGVMPPTAEQHCGRG